MDVSTASPDDGQPVPLELVSLYLGLLVLGFGQSAALLPVLPDMQVSEKQSVICGVVEFCCVY